MGIIWILSVFQLIVQIIPIILCWLNSTTDKGAQLFHLFAAFGTLFIWILILTTLLLRLYFTFRDSIYKMSKLSTTLFAISYAIMILVGCCSLAVIFWRTMIGTYTALSSKLLAIFMSSLGFIYCSITASAISLFAKNLMTITNLRASSFQPIPSHDTCETQKDVKLNEEQMKMIENATKIVSLIVICILTSLLTVSFMAVFGYMFSRDVEHWDIELFQIVYIVKSIDVLINVICLYLQCSFAKKHYKQYCVLSHKCWRYILTQKAAKSLYKKQSTS